MHPVTSGFPSFFLVSAPPHPSLSLANRPGLLSFYSQHETALGLEALSSFPASRNVLLVFLRGKANSRSGSGPPHLAPKCHGRKSRERQERRAANPQVSDSLGNPNKNTLRERSTRFWFTLTTFPPKGSTGSFTFWAHHGNKGGKKRRAGARTPRLKPCRGGGEAPGEHPQPKDCPHPWKLWVAPWGSSCAPLALPPGPVPAPSRVLLPPCTPRPGCSRRPMALQPSGSPGSEAASFSAAIAVCLHLPRERERSNKVLVRGALNPQNGFYLSPPAAAISHPPLLPPQGNQSKRG